MKETSSAKIKRLGSDNKSLKRTLAHRDKEIERLTNALDEAYKVIANLEKTKTVTIQNTTKEGEMDMNDDININNPTIKEYLQQREEEIKARLINMLASVRSPKMHRPDFLDRFKKGEMFYDKFWETNPKMHILHSMFAHDNLLIRIHPENGRRLNDIDRLFILEHIKDNVEYEAAIKELKSFYANNPKATTDEIAEYTYKAGKKLLPIYKDLIL